MDKVFHHLLVRGVLQNSYTHYCDMYIWQALKLYDEITTIQKLKGLYKIIERFERRKQIYKMLKGCLNG